MTYDSFIKKPEYSFLKNDSSLKNIAFLVIGGSHAYGLNTENSDIDLRGFFINYKEFYSITPQKDYFEDQNTDTVLYSFRKFIKLLTACNPNIITLVGTPDENILLASDISDIILENKHLFLSKRIFVTFAGYATQQLRRLENALALDQYPQDIKEEHILKSIESELLTSKDEFKSFDVENDFNFYIEDSSKSDLTKEIFVDCNLKHIPLRELSYLSSKFKNAVNNFSKLNHRNRKKDNNHLCKHASCLIQLLLSAIDILRTGEVRSRLDEHLDLLKDIRFGRMEFEQVFDLYNKLEVDLQDAHDNTKLPDHPDFDKIDILIKMILDESIRSKG